MNKKASIFLLFLLVLFLAILGFSLSHSKVQKTPANFSDHMRGRVTEVSGRSITIAGVAQSIDNSWEENKTIVFEITPKTIFKQQILAASTEEQIKSGKEYTPGREDQPGAVLDLSDKPIILRASSDVNLFTTDKANAVEIYYLGKTPILK